MLAASFGLLRDMDAGMEKEKYTLYIFIFMRKKKSNVTRRLHFCEGGCYRDDARGTGKRKQIERNRREEEGKTRGNKLSGCRQEGGRGGGGGGSISRKKGLRRER